MNTNITIDSSEFKKMYKEVSALAEAKRKREELSDTAFRDWICVAIEELANLLGYHIQNLYEFTLDMGYSFKKGFGAGREEARKRSLRYREGEKH
ncbi:MAG: hypothetical protein ACOX04_04210 [Candidatus Scatomorpha sp.]